jgi:hypothetical protein
MRAPALLLSTAGLALLLAANLPAQIRFPGQTYPGGGGPYPGSGSPNPNGGPYPNGGSGTGGGVGRGRGNGSSSPRNSRNGKDPLPTITTTGMLRLVSGSQFVLEADDHRIITYRTSTRTKVEKDGKTADLKDFAKGDHFTVDSTADEDGFFTATSVTFNLAGTAADREVASETWNLPTLAPPKAAASASGAARTSGGRDDDDRPILRRSSKDGDSSKSADASPVSSDRSASASTAAPAPPEEVADDRAVDERPTTLMRPSDPAPDADDPGRPALRRGRPTSYPRPVLADDAAPPVRSQEASAPTRSTANERAPRATEAPSIIPIESDPIIAKAKAAAEQYGETLPDFFCRQVTTRYQSERPKDGWQALDTVTADVAYENGKESYKNIKVGNKSVNTENMEAIGGSSSSGEFASILEDLFSPLTAATFRKSGQDSLRGRAAYTYKYEVKRENSHWRISAAGQLYYPAFRGTVWIDRETSRVLRIEMESRNVPILFPFDKTETATDYDFVRLSSPQQYLMPVTAEVLSCESGSSRCSRNRIEFRNYRKFGAESDITFSN